MKATMKNKYDQINSIFLIILCLTIMINPINSKDKEKTADDYTLLFELDPIDLQKLDKYTYMFEAQEESYIDEEEKITNNPMLENEQEIQTEVENNTYIPEIQTEESKFLDQEKKQLMNQDIDFDDDGNIIHSEIYTQLHEDQDLIYHYGGEDYIVSEMYKYAYENLIENENARKIMGIKEEIDTPIVDQENYSNDDYNKEELNYSENENYDDYDDEEEDDYEDDEKHVQSQDEDEDEDEDDENDEEEKEKKLSLAQKSSAVAAAANAYINNNELNEDYNNYFDNDIQENYNYDQSKTQTESQNNYSRSSTFGYSDEEIRSYINPSDDLEDTTYLDNMDYLNSLKHENKQFDSLGFDFKRVVAKLMVHNAFRNAPVYFSQQIAF